MNTNKRVFQGPIPVRTNAQANKQNIHPNKIPLKKPDTNPKHNKYVLEISKPHPKFDGVQKIRQEEAKYLIENEERRIQQRDGKYIEIKRYKFKPDVWIKDGEIFYENPYKEAEDPDQNIYVKRNYEIQKQQIQQKKIQILKLQQQAQEKRKKQKEEELAQIRKKHPQRKYSNEIIDQQNQELEQQLKDLQEQNEYSYKNDYENYQDDDDEENNYDDYNNNSQNDQSEEQKQEFSENEDENQCKEIEDFGDFDEDENQSEKQKNQRNYKNKYQQKQQLNDGDNFEDYSFEEDIDISQSFVSQASQNLNMKKSGKFKSDFANQLDNAFSELVSSQSTQTSNVFAKKKLKNVSKVSEK